MAVTKVKNDTASVTAAIMAADINKNKKPAAKAKPKAIPAPAEAEEKAVKKKEAVPGRKEDTAVVMSTDAFSKEILTEFQRRTKAIRKNIGAIDSSFETIAFNLHWINAKQAFKADGYATIAEYADDQFGYQKTTCYSLIAIVDRFAKRDEKGALMESFDDRVKGYGASKLSLMCNLTDAEIDSLSPSMSVREIKKFVKGLMGKSLPELSEGDGGAEGENDRDTEDGSVIDVDVGISFEVLIKCMGRDDFDQKAGKINDYVARVFARHPDAVIEISYGLPEKKKA